MQPNWPRHARGAASDNHFENGILLRPTGWKPLLRSGARRHVGNIQEDCLKLSPATSAT